MEIVNLNAHILDFYKNAVKTSFDVLNSFSAQSAAFTDRLLRTIPSFPEEGKIYTHIYLEGSKKGLSILREYFESHLEFGWTNRDAPVKSLEAMETFGKEPLNEVAEIQKEIIYLEESKKGLAILRKYLDCHLEPDWTIKDAPAKSLEAMEDFNKNAFKEIAEIKNKMKPLIEKAIEHLPRESKELVAFSNELVNGGSDSYQDKVIKNIDAAQKTLGEVSAMGNQAAK